MKNISNQTIKILYKQKKDPFKRSTARGQWWSKLKEFDGKKVKELNASLGKAGLDNFNGWLSFFEKDGLIELIEDAETDE